MILSLDDVIRVTGRPYGRAALAVDLGVLGLRRGQVAIVHVSLSAMGYVIGGAATVLHALIDTLGEEGTLVMPSQSADLTDPATWRSPAVPPDWIDPIAAEMPAYDPARTPTWRLGAVAELFRTWPGVGRSAHPVCSFAALGRDAARVLDPHVLDDPFGETSPLARLYALDARILLIGTSWATCTALHLAERRAAPHEPPEPCLSPVLVGGRRELVAWCEYPHDSSQFPKIGEAMDQAGLVTAGWLGGARARLATVRDAVNFAAGALSRRE